MPKVVPFRGMHFNTGRVGDLGQVVTQPYDKIPEELNQKYLARSQFNVVRIIRADDTPPDAGMPDDKYERARQYEDQWLGEQVFAVDEEPAFYVYHQEYTLPGGEKLTRRGIVGLLECEWPGTGSVYPHEKTHHGPKEDRLKLVQSTETHWGQIFMLYTDPKLRIEDAVAPHIDREPDYVATDDFGDTHRMWAVSDDRTVRAIQKELKRKDLFIADGHHRYETSCHYADEMATRVGEFEDGHGPQYVMVSIVNMDGEGLSIFAGHRILYGLDAFRTPEQFVEQASELFEVRTYDFDGPDEQDRARRELEEDLRFERMDGPCFGAAFRDHSQYYLLKARDSETIHQHVPGDKSDDWKKLDVNILHSIILDRYFGVTAEDTANEDKVHYVRWVPDGLAMINDPDGKHQAALFLNPVTMEEIRTVVKKGERFPEKSTDFYPKMLSGMVMYKMLRKEQTP